MNNDDINEYVPSLLNPRTFRKQTTDFSLTQNSITSHRSLSLRRCTLPPPKIKLPPKKISIENQQCSTQKENSPNLSNVQKESQCKITLKARNLNQNGNSEDSDSLHFSMLDGLNTEKDPSIFSPFSFQSEVDIPPNNNAVINDKKSEPVIDLISVSSTTEVDKSDLLNKSNGESTIVSESPIVTVSIGINNCDNVNLSTKHGILKNVLLSRNQNNVTIDCEILEHSEVCIKSDHEENMDDTFSNPLKRAAVSVSLEIKKKKVSTEETGEKSKVLILNTDAIEKLSHVIVQPPNYKIVKRKFTNNKFKKLSEGKFEFGCNNAAIKECNALKQTSLDAFLSKTKCTKDNAKLSNNKNLNESCDNVSIVNDAKAMSRASGTADSSKAHSSRLFRTRTETASPVSARTHGKREEVKRSGLRSSHSHSEAPRVPSPKKDRSSSNSPRKNVESMQFALPKTKSNRTVTPKLVPYYKIVAGTHFAVDAFSYGDIPNVKHYFLTHFHSDHYSGLKKTFNKILYCSKITGDLCTGRLGVSARCVRVLALEEPVTVEGVEVVALDANHCPGALMLLFTLPNGRSMLHTGDFRAAPHMESYPVFWNRDVHTVYLDTTYCNPRYDFPTQEQSLEMALHILLQKKMSLEKAGKKFSSVLIVCGTYTIGKEKFFQGMARRVGCKVWACPEKDKVLQVVESGGAAGGHVPAACQLHVLPMRDLAVQKLRSYLDSLDGAFSEVVAFKPSGWENGKNSIIQEDRITIHGIPYSEHSSFSEMIRFVKFLKPRQVVPTVDIAGGVKAVQKYFPCPLVYKEEMQSRVTDYFSIQPRPPGTAVT